MEEVAKRAYIKRCQICGEELESGHRKKLSISDEYMREQPNGKLESQYKVYWHAVICERCAAQMQRHAMEMRES